MCGYYVMQHWRGVIDYLALAAIAAWGGGVVQRQANRRGSPRSPTPLVLVSLVLLLQIAVFTLVTSHANRSLLVVHRPTKRRYVLQIRKMFATHNRLQLWICRPFLLMEWCDGVV